MSSLTGEGEDGAPKLPSMADDDDDEGFGDFKFASSSNPNPNPDPQPNRIPDLDDEWGDFVDNSSPNQNLSAEPVRFGLPNGHSQTQSQLAFSKTAESFDLSRSLSSLDADSVPGRVEAEKIRWVRPQGALPLSLFGEDEEEEKQEERDESADLGSSFGDARNNFAQKSIDSAKSEAKMNARLSFNDVIGDLYGQLGQIKSSNGTTLGLNGKDIDFDSKSSNGLKSDLNALNSSPNNSNFTISGSNLDGLIPKDNGLDLAMDFVDVNENFEDGEGWEFKGAGVESGRKDWKFEELGVAELSGSKVESPEQIHNQGKNWEGLLRLSGSGNSVHGSNGFLTSSTGITAKPGEMVVKVDFMHGVAAESVIGSAAPAKASHSDFVNGIEESQDTDETADDDVWEFMDASSETIVNREDRWAFEDAFSEKPKEETNTASNCHKKIEINTDDTEIHDVSSRSGSKDADIWDFQDAFLESTSKHQEDSVATYYSPNRVEAPPSGDLPRNQMKSDNHKQPLPFSFFSDEILDTDDSLNLQEDYTYKPTSTPASRGSNMPINDLISNLYNQAEHARVDSTETATDSDIQGDGDGIDDNSSELKDASLEIMVSSNLQDLNKATSAVLELNNLVEFYSKMKDKLCLVVQIHFDTLKLAESGTAISSEGTGVGLDDEIQEAYKELQQNFIFPDEVSLDGNASRHIDLSEFVEILHQPKFHLLNLEYHLQGRLLLAEKELNSAIELLKHAAAMIKILKLGSEEPSSFVSTWSKMLSACAQELKHGALVWKQALAKKVHGEIVSKPQVQKFILALGKIYQVVEVIGAARKLYKPWVLLQVANFTGISATLDDCYNIWSSSGLYEALESLPEPIGVEYVGTTKALLESIKLIRGLDATSLQKHNFSQHEPTCAVSLLTQRTSPGMKLESWNGECYFLTIANLWANLISCDPPKLPSIHVG